MSNNSAVVVGPDGRGGEIGRAQAMQAAACGLAPDLRFNPVLLKPGSDLTSQVVLLGEAVDTVTAGNFRQLRPRLAETAYAALAELRADVRRGDLRGRRQPGRDQPAGRRLRRTWGWPGTPTCPRSWSATSTGAVSSPRCSAPSRCSTPADQALIAGFVINKFRGDLGPAPAGPGHAAPGDRPPHVRGAALGARPVARRRGLARLRPGARPARRPARQRLAATSRSSGCPGSPTPPTSRRSPTEPGVRVRLTVEPAELAAADLVVLPGSQVDRRRPAPGCGETGLADAVARPRGGRQAAARHLRRLPDARPGHPRPGGEPAGQRARARPAAHRDHLRSAQDRPAVGRHRRPGPAGARLRDPPRVRLSRPTRA